MIAREERDDLDLFGSEAAQIAVLDQVVGMAMVALVADVHADVVQERRVLEPFPLAIPELVDGPRLVEDREGDLGDLSPVLGPVAAALAKLDDAAAADVGIVLDLLDPRGVAVNVVEDQAFTQREIAQRQVLGADALENRVEQDRAGDRDIGATRSRPGVWSRASRSTAVSRLRTRRMVLAGTRWFRNSSGATPASSLNASAPRLRIVPEVPITRSKPRFAISSR